MKIKCKCGKLATWYYMPAEHKWVCCDNCVPRGCSCNVCEVNLEGKPEGIEGKDFRWLVKNESFEELDGDGQDLPCCEWWYKKEGWDNENI